MKLDFLLCSLKMPVFLSCVLFWCADIAAVANILWREEGMDKCSSVIGVINDSFAVMPVDYSYGITITWALSLRPFSLCLPSLVVITFLCCCMCWISGAIA